jgi:hypothetical protein
MARSAGHLIWLDHPNQPFGRFERIIKHRQIARLKHMQRQTRARQKERIRQRKYRQCVGKID